MLPEQFPSVSLLFESLCGHFVERCAGRSQEFVPGAGIPDFRVIVDPDEHNVARKARELDQPFRNANSALRIQFDLFGSGIEQPLVIPDFGAIR